MFEINGENYGEKIQINLIIKEKKNDDLIKVNVFRENFGLDPVEFPDEKILESLIKCHNNFKEAFCLLFD